MSNGAWRRRLLLCWTLWGTVWGHFPEEYPERWRVEGTYASQAACAQASWQVAHEQPDLQSEQLEEDTMRVLAVIRLTRSFDCRPCAAEAPGPTGREE